MPFGHTHNSLRSLANAAINAFYARIEVVGEDNVPESGPLIVVANHWNMTVDPAMLSCNMPHARQLHYWAKDSLFANKYARAILLDAGNLPVDRKTKDNQKLFASTFEALKAGEAVAVFPEGTSLHVHDIPSIKDGASWAALEYAKNLREKGSTLSSGAKGDSRDVVIAVAGLTYTDKTRYRSCVVMEFGPAISVEPYVEEFLREPKSAVKKLSAKILEELRSLTVNAPDWPTLDAATMARQLLWRYDTDIPLQSFRALMQALVAHFADNNAPAALKRVLLEFSAALKDASIVSSSLGPATLPRDLDPNRPVRLPGRFYSLFTLIRSSLSSVIRLPFFAFPLIIHLPLYLVGRIVAPALNVDDVESFAQNKIVLGLLCCFVTYPAFTLGLWALFASVPFGGLAAVAFSIYLFKYHNALVASHYHRGRRLMTSWRILLAVWLPQVHRAGKPVESRMRRLLRLRAEAARALHAHLLQLEQQGGKGAALVSRLRAAGAALVMDELSSTSADELSPR